MLEAHQYERSAKSIQVRDLAIDFFLMGCVVIAVINSLPTYANVNENLWLQTSQNVRFAPTV